MSRHAVTAGQRRPVSPVVLLSALLVVALIGWLSFELLKRTLGASSCDQTTVVTVHAAPEIASVVAQAGRSLGEDACYRVSVTSRDSAEVTESLIVSDGSEAPNVWIPESTLWLQRAQDKGAWNTPVTGPSVASSPVVIALSDDAANRLGWPDRTPTWAQVLAQGDLPMGYADPATDPVGVSTLVGLHQMAGDAPATITATLRRLAANTVEHSDELFLRLNSGSIAAAPVSERALLRQNVKQGKTQLVAAYADPPVPSLDYPYVILPGTTGDKRAAAEKFLGKLLDGSVRDPFDAAGFRGPDGKVLRDRSKDKRTSNAVLPPVPLPGTVEVNKLLNEWAGANLSGRLQILFDVSGSMNEPVPGTGKTRLSATIDAATSGIGLFKQTTKLSLWLFSTNLDGERDYKEFLPMRTVRDHLAAGALNQLATIQAHGGTGLYDSVLAAYQSARQHWEAGKINVVLVFTDGHNEDPAGINRQQLLAELAKLQDPKRPLPIVAIGMGNDIDTEELKAITSAADGQMFTTTDPSRIADIFYAALSKLACQPPACKPSS